MNPEEFDGLFEQYKGIVYRTARLILGDASEADDVLQEVFIKIYKLWHSFDPGKGALSTWMHRITVNECLTKRKKNPAHSQSLDELELSGYQLSDDCEHSDDQVALKQSIEQLLDSLSCKYRAALVLRYFDDLTYENIAEVLQIPLGTVKSRISAALLALRKRVKGRLHHELRTN